ncbi:hypothetical protein [Polynucleobacter sp. JS-JIR-II-b4]|uniref:hypothetical protein n=1 Tax=Polynucleobacter sp. JS-JIR-II-b4 TaxID=1758390 RepID=UPI001BFEA918|nr:hypothetical protein [Polynucleobacter sp. JS-JIR-II-b4]QWE02309.1 hypothetical protein ICV90_09030 [Polynucleobacter sp. JS-JIR-II-b4]
MGNVFKKLIMKKFIPNIAVVVGVGLIFILDPSLESDKPNYWNFLTSTMVLNVGLVFFGLTSGYFVRSYMHIFICASFLLLIYSALFFFESEGGIISQYFLAVYTVFLGSSALGNFLRNFRDWLLPSNELI